MSTKYKAVQVTKPGKLEIVEKAITEPASGQVRIRVEACGVCHTDALTVEGAFPGINYPRVPGHEVVGTIEAIGPDVDGWKEGQRVGVGLMAGHCEHCQPCRRGDFVNCANQVMAGISSDVGTMTVSPIAPEDTLSFSSQQGIHPMTETFGLEHAPEAYERMMSSHARFRIVLTVGE
jgi:D-arabinose 1-dehydrogenase-like Zn-dependent alcohol dehydrogenase